MKNNINITTINFSKLNISRWIVFFIDLIIVVQTFIIAYLVRFNFSLHFDTHQFIKQLPLVIIAASISFLLSGSYKGIVRHTTFKDAENVFKTSVFISILLSGLTLIARNFLLDSTFSIPLSIIVIHFLLNTILLISSRFIFKYLFNLVFNGLKEKKAILIFGTNKTSISTEQTVSESTLSDYKVIGFVSDKKEMIGKTINGKKIYALDEITKFFIEKQQIQELFIPTKAIATESLLKITEQFLKNGIIIKKIPPFEKWMHGDLELGRLKKVKIKDLLNREVIQLDNPKHQAFFNEKVILITGGAGSIGSELVRQISNYPHRKIIILDKDESGIYAIEQELKNKKCSVVFEIADIRNQSRIAAIFEIHKPNIIFHAAAYKHVPLMELFPYEAVATNILGTKIIADLAIKHQAERFVMISTDKAVRPTNVMGASKRFAEKYLLSLDKKNSQTAFITTRFGNVLASNGSVIPLFQKQLENKEDLTVTHRDIERYFMTIPEACQLVIEAALMGDNGKIFVFDMGKSIKIFDVAKKMIQLSGLRYPEDIDIKIIGLRPGEKLYEELFEDPKNLIATHHEKIMIAQNNSEISTEQMQEILQQIANEKDNNNPERIKSLLKTIVRSYTYNV